MKFFHPLPPSNVAGCQCFYAILQNQLTVIPVKWRSRGCTLRFRPLSTRRWFAPRNSSWSAFFSAILYDLRSLHPGTCLNTKTPYTFRLKRAFPTRISKSASFWLCSWQANWTRPRKRLGYDFNFLSTASGTVDQCTMLTSSPETPRLNLWSWSTNKTARWN